MTFEKVLEIFEDYLAQDMELEVYKSRYGHCSFREAVCRWADGFD